MLHAQTLVVTAVQARHWQEPHGRSRSRGILPNQFILYTTTQTWLFKQCYCHPGRLGFRGTSKAQSRRDITPDRRSRPSASLLHQTRPTCHSHFFHCMHLPTTTTHVRQVRTSCQPIYPPLPACIRICIPTRLSFALAPAPLALTPDLSATSQQSPNYQHITLTCNKPVQTHD